MKKNLLFIVIMTVCSLFIVATSFAADKPIKDTTLTVNGVKASYKVFEGGRGGKYVIVKSKTGSTYKKYFKTK